MPHIHHLAEALIQKGELQLRTSQTLSDSDKLEKVEQLPQTKLSVAEKNSISVYGEGRTTDEGVAKAFGLIGKAFPKLHKGFYSVLEELANENLFTDQRLLDSVKHVIRTCPYPEPTVAQFLSFDLRIETKTYEQLLDLNSKYPGVMAYYKKLDEDKWVLASEAKQLGL